MSTAALIWCPRCDSDQPALLEYRDHTPDSDVEVWSCTVCGFREQV